MKRGRPVMRSEVQRLILESLKSIEVPISTNALCKLIREKTGKNINWNTVHKYLEELVKIGRVESISTPHSKLEEKRGITVYILKK